MGNAGFRGLRSRSDKRTAAYRRQRQANTLAQSFVGKVMLVPGCEHSLPHTRNVLRDLLKKHDFETVRGLVQDVTFLSEEAAAGRVRCFGIESVGLLISLIDEYEKTGRVDVIGRKDSPDSSVLVMLSLD